MAIQDFGQKIGGARKDLWSWRGLMTSDIENFNKIAIETLQPLGETFDDLYEITKDAPDSCWSDMTHFNTLDGIKLVGNRVVDCVCTQLGIDREALAQKEAELFEIPEKILGC